jgi:hypothetical protein
MPQASSRSRIFQSACARTPEFAACRRARAHAPPADEKPGLGAGFFIALNSDHWRYRPGIRADKKKRPQKRPFNPDFKYGAIAQII